MSKNGKNFILILMSYDPLFTGTFNDLIEPSCSIVVDFFGSDKLEYVRSDLSKEYTGKVSDQLKLWMHDCAFFVSDITKLNPNVMYELGYLCARKKKGILLHQRQIRNKKLPFYIKDDNVIMYSLADDIEKKRELLANTMIKHFKNVII